MTGAKAAQLGFFPDGLAAALARAKPGGITCAVYVHFAQFANGEGLFWWSPSKVRAALGISEGAFREAVRWLVRHGWIQPTGEKKGAARVFLVVGPRAESEADAGPVVEAADRAETGDQSTVSELGNRRSIDGFRAETGDLPTQNRRSTDGACREPHKEPEEKNTCGSGSDLRQAVDVLLAMPGWLDTVTRPDRRLEKTLALVRDYARLWKTETIRTWVEAARIVEKAGQLRKPAGAWVHGHLRRFADGAAPWKNGFPIEWQNQLLGGNHERALELRQEACAREARMKHEEEAQERGQEERALLDGGGELAEIVGQLAQSSRVASGGER